MSVEELEVEERLKRKAARELSALSVIDNQEFQLAFISYRADLFDSLSKTNWKEVDLREEIYRQIKTVDKVESTLIKTIQDGKVAREQLGILARAAKSIKNMVG